MATGTFFEIEPVENLSLLFGFTFALYLDGFEVGLLLQLLTSVLDTLALFEL